MYVGFMDSHCPRRKSARSAARRAPLISVFLGTFAVFIVCVFTAWISGRFAVFGISGRFAVFVRSVLIAWQDYSFG